jgi:hypothetical protein
MGSMPRAFRYSFGVMALFLYSVSIHLGEIELVLGLDALELELELMKPSLQWIASRDRCGTHGVGVRLDRLLAVTVLSDLARVPVHVALDAQVLWAEVERGRELPLQNSWYCR